MNTIRISRTFSFDASHALQASNGHCKPIHGHHYQLRVTLLGQPEQTTNDHKRGMVMNFKDLSRLVETQVIKPLADKLLLHEDAPAGLIESWQKIDKKLVLLPFQPTCENLLLDIRDKLLKHLDGDVVLHSLRLQESEHAFAEWYASDNFLVGCSEFEDKEQHDLLLQDCLHKANAACW